MISFNSRDHGRVKLVFAHSDLFAHVRYIGHPHLYKRLHSWVRIRIDVSTHQSALPLHISYLSSSIAFALSLSLSQGGTVEVTVQPVRWPLTLAFRISCIIKLKATSAAALRVCACFSYSIPSTQPSSLQ